MTQPAHSLLADYPRSTTQQEAAELRSVAKNIKWHLKRAINRIAQAEKDIRANQRALNDLEGKPDKEAVSATDVVDPENGAEQVLVDRGKRDRDEEGEVKKQEEDKKDEPTETPPASLATEVAAAKRSTGGFLGIKASPGNNAARSASFVPPSPFGAPIASSSPSGGRPRFVFNAKPGAQSTGGGFLSGGRGGHDAKAKLEEQEKLRQQRAAIDAQVRQKQIGKDKERIEMLMEKSMEVVRTNTAVQSKCQAIMKEFAKVLNRENTQLEDDWAASFNLKAVANGYPIYFLPKHHDEMTAMMVASQLDKLVDEYSKYRERCLATKKAGDDVIAELVNASASILVPTTDVAADPADVKVPEASKETDVVAESTDATAE